MKCLLPQTPPENFFQIPHSKRNRVKRDQSSIHETNPAFETEMSRNAIPAAYSWEALRVAIPFFIQDLPLVFALTPNRFLAVPSRNFLPPDSRFLDVDQNLPRPDAVLKFKTKLHSPFRTAFLANILARRLFCLFIVQTREKSCYVLVYAPVQTLQHEAERLSIEFATRERRIHYIRGLLRERKERENAVVSAIGIEDGVNLDLDQVDVDVSFDSLRRQNSMRQSISISDANSPIRLSEEAISRDASPRVDRRRSRSNFLDARKSRSPESYYNDAIPYSDTSAVAASPLSSTFHPDEGVPGFVEGCDGTFVGMIQYALTIVDRPITTDFIPFRKETMYMIKGGGADGYKSSLTRRIELFDSTKRNLIVFNVLNRIRIKTNPDENLYSGYRDLIADGVFSDIYAVHDGPARWLNPSKVDPDNKESCAENLRKKIATLMPNKYTFKSLLLFMPLAQIKAYYGEHVGFYFGWLVHYTAWCWLSAIVGSLVFLYGLVIAILAEGRSLEDRFALTFDNALTIPFSLFMSLWAILMLENWKRQEKTLLIVWGLEHISRATRTRPEYISTETRISAVTCKSERYYPRYKTLFRRALASCVLVVGVCAILVFETAVVIGQAVGQQLNFLIVGAIAGGFTILNIVVLSPAYRWLSIWMNDFSNYKTDERYEKEFILKEFILNFLIAYAPVIYVGTLKTWVGKSPGIWSPLNGGDLIPVVCQFSCLSEMSIQIIVILAGLQFARQLLELLFYPATQLYRRCIKKQKTALDPLCTPQFLLDEQLEPWVQRDEMATKVLQFGFLVLFSCVFPLSPVFSLVNNINEIKLDMFRILFQKRRTLERAEGKGIWNQLLHFLVKLSALTNGIIIAFNSRWFEDNVLPLFPGVDALAVRLIFCIVFYALVVATRFVVDVLVPDIPLNVSISQKHKVYLDRLENGQEVTEFEDESQPHGSSTMLPTFLPSQ